MQTPVSEALLSYYCVIFFDIRIAVVMSIKYSCRGTHYVIMLVL